jgi:hypothetical protein
MFNDERDHIVLNENAYFYKRNQGKSFEKNEIKELFKSKNSIKKLELYNKVKESIIVKNKTVSYSILIFKFEQSPSILKQELSKWLEVKIAYLVIVEIDDYVVISSKNISSIGKISKFLEPIDYETLSTLFVDNNTHFESFSLQNTNIAHSAVRNKTITSNNLKDNFSPLGANTYVLKNMRINSNSEKITLALNSSRINNFGKKNGLEEFIKWCVDTKDKIDKHTATETFLSVFSTPVDFKKHIDNLKPSAILFDTNQFYNDLDSGKIQKVILEYERNHTLFTRELKISKYLERFDTFNKIKNFQIENTLTDDLNVQKNKAKTSFILKSDKLKNVKLILEDQNEPEPILNYINSLNDFIIHFEEGDFIYTKRKLFRDSKLRGNIHNFLKIFLTYSSLEKTDSEKGELKNDKGEKRKKGDPPSLITEFPNKSVFRFVEEEFKTKYDYFICDDMGSEWNDHFGINKETISFYHSKHKDSTFSATDFQDVIGQAQKNFGNLMPSDDQLNKKINKWTGVIANTQIKTLRHGSDVNSAINQWKETKLNPNLKREVYIVVDFISKSLLETELKKSKLNNQALQILWFISSYISSAQELGISPYVVCKP